jgi:hypothetical protein
MLSTGLLQHIDATDYDAFYGCTHRCYSMLPRLKVSAKNKKSTHYTDEQLNDNFPTYKITANIEYATGLPCLAVSTLEDVIRNDCGIGFNDVIKPFELEEKAPDVGSYVKFNEVGTYSKTKNLQLMQVALHAQTAYPEASITLNYIDDNKTLCNKAQTVTGEANWPKNVKLRIFQHVADSDNAPTTPIGEEKKRTFEPRKMERRVTKRPKVGLFEQAAAEAEKPAASRQLRNGSHF